MTTSDWITIGSIFATIIIAGFGGVVCILFQINGTLGEIKSEMRNVLARFDNHEKRIKKLEHKRP